MERYDTEQARKSQDMLCKTKGWTNYAEMAAGWYGVCPNCAMRIYEEGGYCVEYAGNHLITCCPFCNKSYVE